MHSTSRHHPDQVCLSRIVLLSHTALPLFSIEQNFFFFKLVQVVDCMGFVMVCFFFQIFFVSTLLNYLFFIFLDILN